MGYMGCMQLYMYTQIVTGFDIVVTLVFIYMD